MALCDPPETKGLVASSREEYLTVFRTMLDGMVQRNVEGFYKKIRAAAETAGAKIEAAPDSLNLDLVKKRPSKPADILRIAPTDTDSSEHFVGRFAPRIFSLKVDERKWWVRSRASVSACTLQRDDGMPKLSWSFEGVPQDAQSTQRPNEGDSVSFLKATNAMATAGIKPLRDAYAEALERVAEVRGGLDLRPGLLRINLADNDTQQFAALVDAMSFDGHSYNDVMAGGAGTSALDGAGLVKSFVSKTAPAIPTGAPVSIEWTRRRDVGVFCRYQTRKRAKIGDLVLAGLTRSTKMMRNYESQPEETWRAEHEPAYLRHVSGARYLSAKLAMDQAVQFDNQLFRMQQPLTPASERLALEVSP